MIVPIPEWSDVGKQSRTVTNYKFISEQKQDRRHTVPTAFLASAVQRTIFNSISSSEDKIICRFYATVFETSKLQRLQIV